MRNEVSSDDGRQNVARPPALPPREGISRVTSVETQLAAGGGRAAARNREVIDQDTQGLRPRAGSLDDLELRPPSEGSSDAYFSAASSVQPDEESDRASLIPGEAGYFDSLAARSIETDSRSAGSAPGNLGYFEGIGRQFPEIIEAQVVEEGAALPPPPEPPADGEPAFDP